MEFVEFPKIARLTRQMVVTEKIDGTNAQVCVTEEGIVLAGARTRWITPEDDNFGFAKWVEAHAEELRGLGPGSHFGEWWGAGIQRGYALLEKRFSLFNAARWGDDRDRVKFPIDRPACCHVVPTLYTGPFDTLIVDGLVEGLAVHGSSASPGFMHPEGVVIYHTPNGGTYFKKTLVKDWEYKGKGA